MATYIMNHLPSRRKMFGQSTSWLVVSPRTTTPYLNGVFTSSYTRCIVAASTGSAARAEREMKVSNTTKYWPRNDDPRGKLNSSPSPLIPLPLGEGDSKRTLRILRATAQQIQRQV